MLEKYIMEAGRWSKNSTRFKFWLCLLETVSLWANYLPSLTLNFNMCGMGTVLTSLACCGHLINYVNNILDTYSLHTSDLYFCLRWKFTNTQIAFCSGTLNLSTFSADKLKISVKTYAIHSPPLTVHIINFDIICSILFI